MEIVKTHIILFLFAIPFLSFPQTEKKTVCLKSFHSLVHKSLSDSTSDSIDVSSDNIRIIFELYVSEYGKIDSASILKDNLQKFGICHSTITSSITGNIFPCLREFYIPNNGILPEKINIIYNTRFLEEGNDRKY